MMLIPEKTVGITKDGYINFSCKAPAFVYLEGSRGKRFLCDFHFHYEKTMTEQQNREIWEKVCEVLIDEREKIKESFPVVDGGRQIFATCWCNEDAFVRLDNDVESLYFCNFHYRKLYYRHMSHDADLLEHYTILDERYFMTKTIEEEAEKLTAI
jgi:hypothetical protein